MVQGSSMEKGQSFKETGLQQKDIHMERKKKTKNAMLFTAYAKFQNGS